MKSKPTNNNPWAALDALMKTEPEPMGPEWFTVDEFADRYKLSRAVAASKLADMHRVGKMKRWKGVSANSRRVITKWSLT